MKYGRIIEANKDTEIKLMKNKAIKLLSLLLAIVMCSAILASCSTNDQVLASGGNNTISTATYSLMTSLMKGNLSFYITSNYGNYNSSVFWNTITDGDTQMTYKEYYTYIVDEKVKTCLAALNLFDELGLSLTPDEIAAVDEEMNDFVKNDGDGSKNTLNGILAQYGANYQTLRDYKIMNAKIAKLSEHLYGTNASKVGENVKQDYLEANYVAFRQILIPTYDYLYVKDSLGDDVYYETDADGKIKTAVTADGKSYDVIAYDTENGVRVDGENGIDANGNKIYFVANTGSDELKIAYRKTGLVARKNALDEKGNKIIENFSAEKVSKLKKEAEDTMKLIVKGDGDGFLDLINLYDNNYGSVADNTVGEMCYLAIGKSYSGYTTNGKMLEDVCKEVAKLEVGDFTLYKSDYGFHIIMRYEPEEKAFAESKYTGWFVDENLNFDFNTDIVNYLFMKRLGPYVDGITFNEEYKSNVDISTITPNYNFY